MSSVGAGWRRSASPNTRGAVRRANKPAQPHRRCSGHSSPVAVRFAQRCGPEFGLMTAAAARTVDLATSARELLFLSDNGRELAGWEHVSRTHGFWVEVCHEGSKRCPFSRF
ncbi:hypothetical protein MRX96_000698 [Rhipicephalus microplus]